MASRSLLDSARFCGFGFSLVVGRHKDLVCVQLLVHSRCRESLGCRGIIGFLDTRVKTAIRRQRQLHDLLTDGRRVDRRAKFQGHSRTFWSDGKRLATVNGVQHGHEIFSVQRSRNPSWRPARSSPVGLVCGVRGREEMGWFSSAYKGKVPFKLPLTAAS